VDWPDGFGLIRASNTTPVLVLRFEGHTPEALARIEASHAGPAAPRQARRPCGRSVASRRPVVALVHGTSRDDKCWPEPHWIELGRRLLASGFAIGLPHGSPVERERSERLAAALGPLCEVWPSMALDALTDRLARCAGVIGVDSGLSHIAVALDQPHVQIYNFDTDWRTGPQGAAHQCSVRGDPTPAVDAVWSAWQAVQAVAGQAGGCCSR
jgi:ADP-heptose:LPS heptosyltransferase